MHEQAAEADGIDAAAFMLLCGGGFAHPLNRNANVWLRLFPV